MDVLLSHATSHGSRCVLHQGQTCKYGLLVIEILAFSRLILPCSFSFTLHFQLMNTSVAHLDEVLPLALRQRAENAVPEAANAAWVDQVVKEVLPAVGWAGMTSQRQIPITVKQVKHADAST